jgi:hypothetical protein
MGSLKEIFEKKAKSNNLRIEWVNYGIAARFDKTIVMNKNILKYENYALSVLAHEIKHSDSPNMNDVIMDIEDGSLSDNIEFCLKNPKGFSQFIPFGRYNGNFFIDANLLLVYGIGIILILLFFILT